MKKILSSIIVILVLLCTGISFAGKAVVHYQVEDMYTNCVFIIDWENPLEAATVEITSPDGVSFGSLTTPERVTVNEKRLLVNVGNATIGEWLIEIDGEGLGEVNISGGEIPTTLNIDEFSVVRVDNTLDAKWKVTGAREKLVYEVYLDDDNQGFNGEKLIEFSAESINEYVISLDTIITGNYFAYMKISDNTGRFSYAYANEEIIHKNQNSKDALNNVNVSLLNDDIYLTWESNDSELYKVMIIDLKTQKIISEELSSEYSHTIAVPEGYSDLGVAVASYDNMELGNYNQYKVSEVEKPKANVLFPDNEAVNTKSVVVNVEFVDPYNVFVVVNDEVVIEKSTESGDYLIRLEEGDNNIVIIVKDKNGNMVTFSKTLYLDTTPPQLSLLNDVDKLEVTSNTISINGSTESAATIYCNNVEIEKIGNNFNVIYELKPGENNIEVSAIDIAGNISKYTATVLKKSNTWGVVKQGSLVGIASVLTVYYGKIVVDQIKKREKNEKNN